MKVKAGAGVHIKRCGDSIQLYSDPVPLQQPGTGSLEEATTPADWSIGEGVETHTYTTWERAEGDAAEAGIKLKVITRTYYDKDADKNFNYYFLLTFSNTGQLLKAEGEYADVAFETTLHEHN